MNYQDTQQYLDLHSLKRDFVTDKFDWSFNDEKLLITIPIKDQDGKLLYNKYRHLTGDAKFSADAGSHPILYLSKYIAKYEDIILCEGEPDCVRLWQEGIPATTGTFGVSTFSEKIAKPLAGKNVYITLDTDEAGQKALQKYGETLSNIGANAFVVTLPSDIKDTSEYFTQGHTRADFLKLKKEAIPFGQYILNQSKEKYPILDNETFQSTEYPPVKWIIKSILRAGGFSIIAGEPGVGKSLVTLSMIKAISEGKPWLDRFETTQLNILRIDKENTPADIQQYFKTMNLRSPNIYNFFSEDGLTFVDEKGNLTEAANYLSSFIKEKQIDLVILDSAIDFVMGDENSSTDVATNINMWKQIFSPATVLAIHHESKQDPRSKRKAADRLRGSSVWTSAPQSIMSLSVSSLSHPERLTFEHPKVRGGKKITPFEIEMSIRPDPFKPGETIVDGFKYIGEVNLPEKMEERAKELIVEYLLSRQEEWVLAKDIKSTLSLQGIGRISTTNALKELVTEGSIELDDTSKAYLYKICVKGVYRNTEKVIEEITAH